LQIFEAGESTSRLKQFSVTHSIQSQFNFYIDRSVINIGTRQYTM
ncbi:3649_t:CDS:1, partial [Racocetra persica]